MLTKDLAYYVQNKVWFSGNEEDSTIHASAIKKNNNNMHNFAPIKKKNMHVLEKKIYLSSLIKKNIYIYTTLHIHPI